MLCGLLFGQKEQKQPLKQKNDRLSSNIKLLVEFPYPEYRKGVVRFDPAGLKYLAFSFHGKRSKNTMADKTRVRVPGIGLGGQGVPVKNAKGVLEIIAEKVMDLLVTGLRDVMFAIWQVR